MITVGINLWEVRGIVILVVVHEVEKEEVLHGEVVGSYGVNVWIFIGDNDACECRSLKAVVKTVWEEQWRLSFTIVISIYWWCLRLPRVLLDTKSTMAENATFLFSYDHIS